MFNRLINTRREDAYDVRKTATEMAASLPYPDHINNGEEERYRNLNNLDLGQPDIGKLSYIANFSKALKHNFLGEVDPVAYKQMVRAMYSTDPKMFERTYMMGTINGLNLVNPQGGLAFDLEGGDPQSFALPPAPRIDSAEASAEMGELYWMALLRDVPFTDYRPGVALVDSATHSLTNEFPEFTGHNPVKPHNLFRGSAPGDLNGPFISQFLLKPVPYGTLMIEQLNKVALANKDYVTDFKTWRRLQNGDPDSDRNTFNDLVENMVPPGQPDSLFEPQLRYICNLRGLTTYVHFCSLYQEYLNAALILLNMPARLDPGNPYTETVVPPDTSIQHTQDGFVTLGPPNIFQLVAEVATRALKAVWYQKWAVHRRLRPEEFGGRIHVQLAGVPAEFGHGAIPAHTRYNGILDGTRIINALDLTSPSHSLGTELFGKYGTYLLPQAFKEGAPAHPSYGSGHATVAGACVTVLKAWFDESEVFDPNIVPPAPALPTVPPALINQMKINRTVMEVDPADPACRTLRNVTPAPILTVGGELNKLASNIAIGRNAAGVHYRSDYWESLLLGEKVAIRFLQQQKLTYNEDFHLSLTKFDGTSIII